MNTITEPPVGSIEKFKDYPLSNDIKRGLSELGFKTPLEVQEKVIPLILEGKDLIVQSQTGSGKTAAFAIPICQMIQADIQSPQALILTPTRELTVQVKEDMAEIAAYTGLTFSAIYGKQPMDIQRKELKQNPQVIVATPGRMMDHLLNKNVKLHAIRFLVIDEADEILMMGFKDQLEAIIKKLPAERITLLFSATIPEELTYLSQEYMISPEKIEIEPEVSTIDKIEQIHYAVDGLKKVDFMKKVMERERPRKAIIFCNTKEQVDSLFEILRKWNKGVCAVHGGMEQHIRSETLKAFKRGEYSILIATDVAARGLHIQDITHVINYSVPFDHEQYVHRIGRTGRVDKHGIAITMVIPSEMDRFNELQEFLGYKIPCKGGHVDRRPSAKAMAQKGKGRFKVEKHRGPKALIQFNAGRSNSALKTGDFLAAIRSVEGISNEDIGKVEMREMITNVEILGGKESLVLSAFKTKRIKGTLYRVKKGGNK